MTNVLYEICTKPSYYSPYHSIVKIIWSINQVNKHIYIIILIYLLGNAILGGEELNCKLYNETIFTYQLVIIYIDNY